MSEILKATKEQLEEMVSEWAYKTFGSSFEFREHQKDACIDSLYYTVNGVGKTNCVIQAPTGSGKSIIAMIVAGVLSEYFDKSGYILISDLGLLEQYIKDVDRYCPDWGYIKGMENYNCKNGAKFRYGDCRIQENLKRISDIIGCKKFSECSSVCPYIQDRIKASRAKVTVCTYHMWFVYTMLEDKNVFVNYGLEQRDFIICDEAHKIVDIIQSLFSLNIGTKNVKYIENLLHECGCDDIQSVNDLSSAVDELLLMEDASSKDIVSQVHNISNIVKNIIESARYTINPLKQSDGTRQMYAMLSTKLSNVSDFYDTLISFVTDAFGANDVIFTLDKNGKSCVLNRLHEVVLVERHFTPFFTNCLCMSATIGDVVEFAKNIAFKDYKYIDIPSTFDFIYSPIYFVPGYKMSYQFKDFSMPHISSMISNIMQMFSDKRGCILVSSYSMAQDFISRLPKEQQKRILTYSNTSEKITALSRFKFGNNNYVLMGPSLFDGISLDDDLCRFLIIAKIPYPDLSNKFCNKKREINKQWYSNQAALSIIQGVGRGVRSNTDWCNTFILDDCFAMLYNMSRKSFSNDFIKRLKTISSDSLIKKNN